MGTNLLESSIGRDFGVLKGVRENRSDKKTTSKLQITDPSLTHRGTGGPAFILNKHKIRVVDYSHTS